MPSGDPDPYAERVLDLVERIPAGHVLAYGDVAEILAAGGGPRQVGRVMALWGGGVPWWRVVRASGQPATGHEREALRRLRARGHAAGRRRHPGRHGAGRGGDRAGEPAAPAGRRRCPPSVV